MQKNQIVELSGDILHLSIYFDFFSIIERLPLVVPPLEPWEEELFKAKDEMQKYHARELPNALMKKKFNKEEKEMLKEIGVIKDENNDDNEKSGSNVNFLINEEDEDEDLSGLLTESNKEQLRKKKLQELFVISPIVTEADRRKDYKSLHRKLDKKLFLITKNVINNPFEWDFMKTEFKKKDIAMRTVLNFFI